MNKRGFVLVETLIVSTIVIISLMSLVVSYNNIINKTNMSQNYDNINDIYKIYYLKKLINTDENNLYITNDNCEEYISPDCINIYNSLNIKYILISDGSSDIKSNSNYNNTLNEYLKSNSLISGQKRIIVEFNRFNKYYYASINY